MTDVTKSDRRGFSPHGSLDHEIGPIPKGGHFRRSCLFMSAGGDVCVIIAAAAAANWPRIGGDLHTHENVYYIMVPAYLVAAIAVGAYRLDILRNPSLSVQRALLAVVFATALVVAFGFTQVSGLPPINVVTLVGTAALGLACSRTLIGLGLSRSGTSGMPHVLLIGDDSVQSCGAEATEVINVHETHWTPLHDDPVFLNEFAQTIAEADRIILSFSDLTERRDWMRLMRQTGLGAEVLEPNLAEVSPLGLAFWGSVPSIVIARAPLSLSARVLKRSLDLGLVLLAAPLVMPLLLLLGILIRLDSPGPALFFQRRVGANNRLYYCVKFRTMYTDCTDEDGHMQTRRGDQRVTRLGSFLRRTSLDELPQLWNVLKGEMSLVGPRPHPLGCTADGALFWEAVPGYWKRHSMLPGLTGLAQIRGYRGPTEERADIENRVAADLEYINNWSLWLDAKILAMTITVLFGRNAL